MTSPVLPALESLAFSTLSLFFARPSVLQLPVVCLVVGIARPSPASDLEASRACATPVASADFPSSPARQHSADRSGDTKPPVSAQRITRSDSAGDLCRGGRKKCAREKGQKSKKRLVDSTCNSSLPTSDQSRHFSAQALEAPANLTANRPLEPRKYWGASFEFPLCDVHCQKKGRCSIDSNAVANETYGLRDNPSAWTRAKCLDRWFRIRFRTVVPVCLELAEAPTSQLGLDLDDQLGLAAVLRIFPDNPRAPVAAAETAAATRIFVLSDSASRIFICAEDDYSRHIARFRPSSELPICS